MGDNDLENKAEENVHQSQMKQRNQVIQGPVFTESSDQLIIW